MKQKLASAAQFEFSHQLEESLLIEQDSAAGMKEFLKNSSKEGIWKVAYIYMQPDLFWVITFDVDMINTQIGFYLKAEMLVDKISGMGSPCLSRKFA